MKAIINRQALVNAFNNVVKIANARSLDAILNNIKFTFTSDGLELIGSNGQVSIITYVRKTNANGDTLVTVDEEGGALAHVRISEIIKKMSDEQIKFEIVDGTILKLSDSKSSFRLNTINVKEYPDLNFDYDENNGFTLSKEVFINIVNQSAFAASTKDSKPLLKCVNITTSDNKMNLVATDGARLAKKTVEVPFDKQVNVNIPAKTLFDVSRMLDNEENVKVIFENNRIVFKFGDAIIISSLVAGEFPSVSGIINRQFAWTLQVNSNELVSALERVSTLFVDNEVAAKLRITEEIVKLSSKSAYLGSTEEIISLFRYDGEDLEIAFNVDFLLQAIKAANQSEVVIKFTGSTKPFVIESATDESLVQVITPVRLYD